MTDRGQKVIEEIANKKFVEWTKKMELSMERHERPHIVNLGNSEAIFSAFGVDDLQPTIKFVCGTRIIVVENYRWQDLENLSEVLSEISELIKYYEECDRRHRQEAERLKEIEMAAEMDEPKPAAPVEYKQTKKSLLSATLEILESIDKDLTNEHDINDIREGLELYKEIRISKPDLLSVLITLERNGMVYQPSPGKWRAV